MTAKVRVISGIVAVVGIIAMIAGFAAEATRIKASEVRIEDLSCVYPRSPALGFGIVAIICTIIIRIILLIIVGCGCRPSGSTLTPLYTVINILSWIASVVAVLLFLAGVVLLSNREGVERDGVLTCYVVKRGIFAVGAMLSIFSTFFGIVAYKTVSSDIQSASQPEFEPPVASDVDVEKSPVHPQQL